MKYLKYLLIILFLIGFYFFTRTLWFEGLIMNYQGPNVAGNTDSMSPTIKPGTKFFTKYKQPKVGDIVVFTCLKYTCNNDPHDFIKRLTKINDKGDWWVLGDNPESDIFPGMSSFDSRFIGWISPSERSNVRVVTEIIPTHQ